MSDEYRTVPTESIQIPQNRIREDVGDLEPLARSIESVGLINPISVSSDLVLVAGFRRLMACRLLGIPEVQVKIVPSRLAIELAENAHRKDLEPLEIGKFVDENWEDLKRASGGGETRALAADLFGVSPPHIDRCRRLYQRVKAGLATEKDVRDLVEDRGVAAADAILRTTERPAPSGGVVCSGELEPVVGIMLCVPTRSRLERVVSMVDDFVASVVVAPSGPDVFSMRPVLTEPARLVVLARGHDLTYAVIYGRIPDGRDRQMFGGHDVADCLSKLLRYYLPEFEEVYDPFGTESAFWACGGRRYHAANATPEALEQARKAGIETR
jgi:hypothetical protein